MVPDSRGTKEKSQDCRPLPSGRETFEAVKTVRDLFATYLAEYLNLMWVPAPLVIDPQTGLNDDLGGEESPVTFQVGGLDGDELAVVHSLAKWKRVALRQFDLKPGRGIYTDMRAIRRDENLDETHSMLVDQWDWEVVLKEEDRTMNQLKHYVSRIYSAIKDTEAKLQKRYPLPERQLPADIGFISTQKLAELYPESTPQEREYRIAREMGSVFVQQIGHPLIAGKPHENRAPDYDDWRLNGDLIVWDFIQDRSLEISSMGIRVDPETLIEQLHMAEACDRLKLPFHRRLAAGDLPPSIGGGIGQSRLAMFLLGKAHIGEVQVAPWPESMRREYLDEGIRLL